MKRIFLLSIVAYLCVSGFTSAETFGDYKYADNGNSTCTITDYTGTGKDITIPDTLDGLTVTGIGNYAFSFCTSLTSVIIPDSVTGIGSYAFHSCTSLTSVIIPDSVTSIGKSAFYSCTSLTSVVIGDSVTSIGYQAFYSCTNLIAITVDTNNPAYASADGVLFNKSQTMLIQYPAGLSGSYAIPESVTWIEDEAFSSCTSLTDVIIPDSVTGIGDYAFDWCTSLTGIFFKGTPPDFGRYPFLGCEVTVYYLAQNAASWPATFGGLPTALWQLSIADRNEDGNVDFFDFLTFAAAWQAVSGVDAAYNGDCDLAEPFGIIDTADLQLFANQWLITPCQ